MTHVQPEDPATIPARSALSPSLAGARVVALDCYDVRFPTSLELDGSDAMNPDPDYSAAYTVLRTDVGGLEGNALCFTIGRGNDVVVAAIEALRQYVVGRPVEEITGGLDRLSAELIGDSQLRWLGPEKGVMHMAIGAVVNAAWDLAAKVAGKPLWRLLADMTPEQVIDMVDFRYIDDASDRGRRWTSCWPPAKGAGNGSRKLERAGYPAYTTAPGWIGYSDEKLVRLCRQAVSDGFRQIKLKVGANPDDDARRLALARDAVGPDVRIAIDANQRWGVGQATAAISALASWSPFWVEEPTSPDEILGLAAIRAAVHPVRIAVGEHVANRVIFKQILQARGGRRPDDRRVPGGRRQREHRHLAAGRQVRRAGVPARRRRGPVRDGSAPGDVRLRRRLRDHADRVIEYVDHLHEHFTHPVRVVGGRYLAPTAAGISATLRPASLRDYEFPRGSVWQQLGRQ